MHIGAIVTIAGERHGERVPDAGRRTPPGTPSTQMLLGTPVALLDVVGKSVLERTLVHLRRCGIDRLAVIAEDGSCLSAFDDHQSVKRNNSADFWSEWDKVVSQYLSEGVDAFLLIRVGAYVEVDVADFVRYHKEMSSALTQVCDAQGALDLVLVDAQRLRQGSGSFRSRLSSLIPNRRKYQFGGYSNRLGSSEDYRRLVEDSLTGRCGIRPSGKEIRPGVWVGSGARIDESVFIQGPAYIGEQSIVHASCKILGISSIERQAEIDCGTIVENSCILPCTYVGMGLRVAGSLVKESRLHNIRRNLDMEIDERLLASSGPSGGIASHKIMKRAAALMPWNRECERAAASTRSTQLASLMTRRWLGRADD